MTKMPMKDFKTEVEAADSLAQVFQNLTKEIGKSFELPHSVFILKIINADLNIVDGGV